MVASNTNFQIAELDFDLIKSNLRAYMQSQSVFADYDFTGSGLDVLLDVLAYNTHYMAYYLNLVGNEMFLDSAVIRDSIVSRAKHLGYVPTSARGAVANVNIVVTPTNPVGLGATLTLPQFTKFQSENKDGNNYTFLNTTTLNASLNVTTNTYTFANVSLNEGEHFEYTFLVNPTNLNSPFILPDSHVDTTTMSVVVQNSLLDTTQVAYTRAQDLTAVTSSSAQYFLELSKGDQYGIYFGDGHVGRPVQNNNLVIIDYLSVHDDAPNGLKQFTVQAPIGGFSNVNITTNQSAIGGTPIESSDSIKLNAPIFYTQQNRAVTIPDYSIILKDYPFVQQVVAWGGEDNIPPVYGKVFISLSPITGFVITETQKTNIINDIVNNRGVVTVTPEIVDPEFLYVIIEAAVQYDTKLTTLGESDMAALVTTTIQNFATQNFTGFGSVLRESKLHAAIDTAHPAILGNDLSVLVQKRIVPTCNSSLNYTITFGTPIHHGAVNDKLFTFPTFKYADSTGALFDCYIEEVPFSFTGVNGVQVILPGSGYTVPPNVTITGDGNGATAHATILNGKVVSIVMDTTGVDYSIASVAISGGGGVGATAQAILSEQFGTLQIVYFKTDGTKIVINDNIGTIDYLNGIIKLINFKPFSIATNQRFTAGVLSFNIEADLQTIIPQRNTILALDTNDPSSVQVQALPNNQQIKTLPF